MIKHNFALTKDEIVDHINERLDRLEREIGLVPVQGNPLGGGLHGALSPFVRQLNEWTQVVYDINMSLHEINKRLIKVERSPDPGPDLAKANQEIARLEGVIRAMTITGVKPTKP